MAHKQQQFRIHPTGWENDTEEERFRLSLFDPIILVVYCHFALYFRIPDEDKEASARVIQLGLEKTLSQVRHLCGTIERDQGGGFSFVKKKDTTVPYVVKWLEDESYPSIDDMESATFSCQSLGPKMSEFGLSSMPYGEGRPESDPGNSPACSGFQLNFVRGGGAVFSSHVHHWAADLVGWSNFTRQLADNCRVIWAAQRHKNNNSKIDTLEWPPWDPACIDVSRFTPQPLPPSSLVDGPAIQPRHPSLPWPPEEKWQALLFHLPKSKAAELKALASSTLGGAGEWISTYDATCAFVWRHLTRVRVPFYRVTDAAAARPAPWFGESVDMRPRFTEPTPPPKRMIRNMLAGGFSEVAAADTITPPIPTIGELIADETETPLSRLAGYIRRLTDSVTQPFVEGLLEYISTLKNHQSISFNLQAKPAMSFFVTDHRPADVSGADFGFGRPLTHRFLTGGGTSANMILVYPASRKQGDTAGEKDDEGTIWSITVEKGVVEALLGNEEWNSYFEFRGLD